jgi:flagellar motility protein MotE (MotC chaperone)
MIDPGTAAIAVLSTVTGVAGYGAMKVNQNQAKVMDELATRMAQEKIEKVRKDLALATQQMKAKAERELKSKQAEVDAFKRDLTALEKSKKVLEDRLQKTTEGERLFVSVSLPQFKKAIETFKKDPEVVSVMEGFSDSKKKALGKVFDNYTNTVRLNVSRGSLQSLFQDLTKAAGQSFMDRAAFDAKFTTILKSVDTSIDEEKPTPEPTPGPTPGPTPEPTPEPTPGPTPEPTPGPTPEANERQVNPRELDTCKTTLRSLGIRTLSDYRKWMLKNKKSPRLGEINNCVDIVLKGRKGGMRKKKLRTRRGTKQTNVRRTRRS